MVILSTLYSLHCVERNSDSARLNMISVNHQHAVKLNHSMGVYKIGGVGCEKEKGLRKLLTELVR